MTKHPFYMVYASKMGPPRKKYTSLTEAVMAAARLSQINKTSAFVIEFDGMPTIFCRCDKDGKVEQAA